MRRGDINLAAFIVTCALAFAATLLWIVTARLFWVNDIDAAKEAAIQATAVSGILVSLLAQTGGKNRGDEPVAVTTNPGDTVAVTEE